jgi:hypothetical protein
MAGMSTCERCGGGVPAGATTCPNCGAPAGSGGSGSAWEGTGSLVNTDPTPDVSTAYSQSEVEQPWSAPAPTPAPPAYTPPRTDFSAPAAEIYSPTSQEKKRGPWVWVIGCCVGVLVLTCCLVVIAIAIALAPITGL